MTCPHQMLPRHRSFGPPHRISAAPTSLPQPAGAFIYDHLGRVEQTYVAKGRLFLFIKFMASPRLHTVKTGRIGPKVSCRMTASDVRTSVNSVGAVEGNKVGDSSKAHCPITRCGEPARRKGIGAHRGEERGGVCEWPGQVALGPLRLLATHTLSLGHLGLPMLSARGRT